MTFFSKLREYYTKHPFLVILAGLFTIISGIVVIYSFADLLLKLYSGYSNSNSGTQILFMTIISLLILIPLILLITAYIIYKIDDSMEKKFKKYVSKERSNEESKKEMRKESSVPDSPSH